jgi:hypothetical protein
MNAIEIADWISEYLEDIAHEPWGNDQIMMDEAQTMLRQQQVKIAELRNARDYWCLQYKDVFSKLESLKYWQDTWRPFLKEHFGVDK